MARSHMLLAALMVATARAITKELYTTNAVCKQQYCVNPVFPGLQAIPHLENERWTKHTLGNVSGWLEFCGGVVDYDLALPETNGTASMLQRYLKTRNAMRQHGVLEGVPRLMSPTEELVRKVDKWALTTYFMHLSAMGIEAWDHTDPMKESDDHPLRGCARSVARLACHTYFPRAYSSLADGTEIGYTRPCKSSCESFLEACGVDCCDDSTSCVWDKFAPGGSSKWTQDVTGATVVLETGYVDVNGPSFQCTGGR